jgi:flagellar M-ring protein FliF
MNQSLLQLGRQLAAIWKDLGLNQRLSLVLAGAVVLVGLGGLVYWSSRVDYALLYGRLDPAEAGKVTQALEEAKVPYRVGAGGGSILVPADKVHQVRMQLASQGIPRGEGVGFEIFDKPNFGISDFVQRANYTRAIQGELARTISQLDLVESARVMIVMPEHRLLVDNQRKPTASVFVRVRGNATLPASSVNSIRFLVANSVEGLTANNVTVVDNLGNVLSENQDDGSAIALSANQLTARRNFEQYLTKKAEGMLEKVLGPGQAVVRVSAEINWDTLTRTEEKFDPEGQVARKATINDETVESTTAGSGGVPGVASNTAPDATNTTGVAGVPLTNSRTKKKVTDNEYEINKITSTLMQGAGGIKRLSAAVFVAQRFEGTGADRKPVPRSPEELQKLRRIVQSALGIQEGDTTRNDEITLEEMPFNDAPALELTQQLDRQQRRQFWADLAQKLVYPALALGVLGLFWRALKQAKHDDIPIGLPLGDGHGNGHGNGHAPGHEAAPNEPPPGLVTVEMLNQLIRENPNNMTQAMRAWLARGRPLN